jgi:DNA (cytosine-5)-methyltransferase 1
MWRSRCATCPEPARPQRREMQVAGALALEPAHEPQTVQYGWRVRRLTPTECERLQGFPDGYTDIPWRNKEHSPDGPRYKALGNSMAVNAMRWIGRRIEMVEANHV